MKVKEHMLPGSVKVLRIVEFYLVDHLSRCLKDIELFVTQMTV